MTSSIATLQELAKQVRRDIIRMIHLASSGHPGGSLGNADVLTALYFHTLQQSPATWRLDGRGQDMFFLSIGHVSPVFYSVLARAGYIDVKQLNDFRRLGSPLQGHPSSEWEVPGVHVATGSLGQGLSVACGAALAKKMNNDPHLVYALLGDGEAEEGQIWEATMFAAARSIDNLIAIVDWNGQQIDGPVRKVLDTGDLDGKWRAFGWETLAMKGNDMSDVVRVLDLAKAAAGKGKPIIILSKTEMGYGVDFMQGTHEWHGKPINDDQAAKALSQLPTTKLGDF
ncbi:MAG: transketolase [Prevotellaceae bacterium]|jgi:transketolase|nr:transketolase [Prevotellaceae bacterium]